MGFEAGGAALADWLGASAATEGALGTEAGLAAEAGGGLGTLGTIGAGAGTVDALGTVGTAGATAVADTTPLMLSGPAATGAGIMGGVDAAMASTPLMTSGPSYLPVTGSAVGPVAQLSPELASSLGVAPATGTLPSEASGPIPPESGPLPTTQPAVDPTTGLPNVADPSASPDSDMTRWLKNNKLQAALLGTSVLRGAFPQQLPGAAKTALGASTEAVQQAQGILASGGTSSPQWQQQKSSIDASVNQNLQQAIAQMQQSAVNSGMGGADSGVVQQQIARLKSEAETQRQTLYTQALTQIVNSAVSELTGGNQTLGSIAQMQMSSSQQAQSAAAQTAELALLLGSRGG